MKCSSAETDARDAASELVDEMNEQGFIADEVVADAEQFAAMVALIVKIRK